MNKKNKRWRILFIDDSRTEINYLNLLFQITDLPLDPTFMNSAENALEQLGKLEKPNFPELIVVDINMPLMNGFEFAEAYYEQFHAANPETLLFIYSTTINSADIKKAESINGVKGFVPKPFDENIFNAKIFPHLNQNELIEK